ncbi:MAG: DinB family protein, partial [Candidatus Acidiferrales bacterium]
MTASHAVMKLEPSLLVRLQEARERTDALFALLPPNTFYDRPIPERHRLIFYLGHLEAFDRNLLSGALGIESENSTLDKLFAFGIDPVGGGLPADRPSDWPSLAQVEQYSRGVRSKLDQRLREPGSSLGADPSLA